MFLINAELLTLISMRKNSPSEHSANFVSKQKTKILDQQRWYFGNVGIANKDAIDNFGDAVLSHLIMELEFILQNIAQNFIVIMSYTNVVFNQNIGRTVHRDEVEHQRINDRVGFQSRFQTAGNLIFKPPEQSSLNVTQQERFNKNHETNDKIKRQNDREKQQNFYNARLKKRLERDQQKWNKQSGVQQKQEVKRQHHQKILLQNKKNSNGLGYNPINHGYEESQRGNNLKSHDESKQVNRYVRTKNISTRNNTGFNIITGEDKGIINQPIPEKLRGKVENKYQQKVQREAVKYVPIRDKYDYLDD